MAKKEYKIPLPEMLNAINYCDLSFYDKLDDDQKKEFSPWMAMRFASAADGHDSIPYLFYVNEIVNKDFSSLTKHPKLQWQLLACCGSNRYTKHPWIPPSPAKKSNIQQFLAKVYPFARKDELNMLEEINSIEELKSIAVDHGYSDKEIKETFDK